ncbi:MAG TPA: prepilin peptidase [Gordonia sp. (in: high G+C Gram-positive bacteria)]|uniref:prepilin peptidase n=1 Tax=unclassified Gordonia (in: high G+C Gram-positive bacteria) TaxID=2657482 RepID=UPI000FA4D29D|nr:MULTISPECIES: prepilin peptidase [unclassified Gordonia (in: high G+C Gram-positive bacteria)]RUP35607.1 MAG: prepilin peptidase [Gordonia sp. (in: high G+C Gram-positive bacteria)]HNP58887.1 prepilin peptidase [Gordonia sp. (in: high G+C Gram-positive bacteria)]HRC52599.1 prepilin peptidase [Gordonia sp. (in: high G+C Gram-positive bacteria)]
MEAIVAVWLVALGEVDRATSRLPTAQLLPGIAAVGICGVGESLAGHSGVLVAALVAALPYVVAGLLGHSGGGDLKLAFVVGGLSADPATALLVVGLAQLVALVGFVTERRRLRPHGPALSSVAAILVVGPTFS